MGSVLADPLIAESDQPACDYSAMDGYAVLEDSAAGSFRLIGNIVPGIPASEAPAPGEAIRVFTGSALPQGVKVVMQEDALVEGEGIRVSTMERAGHVRRRGDTAKAGDVLLKSGTVLGAVELGLLASNGIVSPVVANYPRIAHLTTGSEVVPPDAVPSQGQVRNANATLVRALAEQAGASVAVHSHCGESLEEAFAICQTAAFVDAAILIVSGGASVGDHDNTSALIEKLGFEWVFRKVAIRPGKPILLGVRDGRVAIGLPGNPVSHFVTFHLFVRRVIAHLAGCAAPTLAIGRVCDSEKTLERGKLETWWPAIWSLRSGIVELLPKTWLHSGHLSALAGANALLRIPSGQTPADGDFLEFLPCGPPVIQSL
jgi:molybdopterin molybdotransferase